MTPRSAAERGPRTAAGRDALVRLEAAEAAFLTGGMKHAASICVDLQDAILAIEAEAGAAAPTAADAWQAGYEACWNRLKDAGRLLPSSPSEQALTGKMLREAYAALYGEQVGDLSEWPYLRDEVKAVWDALAAQLREREDRLLLDEGNTVAAAYGAARARLASADESGTP